MHKLENSKMFGNIYWTDYFFLSFLSLILQHNFYFLSLFCVFLLLIFCIEASGHSLAIPLHAHNLNLNDNVFVRVFLGVIVCITVFKNIRLLKNAQNLPSYLYINLIKLNHSAIIFIYRRLA